MPSPSFPGQSVVTRGLGRRGGRRVRKRIDEPSFGWRGRRSRHGQRRRPVQSPSPGPTPPCPPCGDAFDAISAACGLGAVDYDQLGNLACYCGGGVGPLYPENIVPQGSTCDLDENGNSFVRTVPPAPPQHMTLDEARACQELAETPRVQRLPDVVHGRERRPGEAREQPHVCLLPLASLDCVRGARQWWK